MFRWTLIFFMVVTIAGILGFGGTAAWVTGIAQVVFFVFLILLTVSAILELRRLIKQPAKVI